MQYLKCGIFSKKMAKVLICSMLLFSVFLQKVQAVVVPLGEVLDMKRVDFGYEYLEAAQLYNSEQLLGLGGFGVQVLGSPAFRPSSGYAYVKYRIRAEATQELYWLNSNVFLDYYALVVYQNGRKVREYGGLSWQKPQQRRPYASVFFVCPLRFEKGAVYDIILTAKCQLLPNRLVSRLLTKAELQRFENWHKVLLGLATGALLLIFLICLGIFLLYRLRLFLIYAFFVLTFWWIYLYITGAWFDVLPKGFFENGVIRIPQLLIYLYFFTNLWFAWAFFKIDIEKKSYLSVFCRVLFGLSLVNSSLLVFYDIFTGWFPGVSFGLVSGFMDVLAVSLNGFMLYCSVLLFKKRALARWYLLATLPGILSVTGLKILESLGLKLWYSLPNIYLGGMLWHALVLMTGFAYLLRYQLDGKAQPAEGSKAAETINSSLLTKREADILMAFANGFSYTEISDAFLISPHTVRTHLKNIYTKLGINSKAEAIRWVLEQR
jgi:DNA-binding CsgD family transcriptional regulator